MGEDQNKTTGRAAPQTIFFVHLYDEAREEEEKKTIRERMDKLHKPVEDKETIVLETISVHMYFY